MCGIYPPDYTTELGQVRLYSGDVIVDEEGNYLVSDEVIQTLLDKYVDKTEPQRLYYTTLQVVFLMKNALRPTAMRMREREGSVEREMYGSERYQHLCDFYKELKRDPSVIIEDFAPAIPKIGGVNKQEMQRVRSNPSSNLPPCRVSQVDKDGDLLPESNPAYRF